jgi:hypothetical protein
MTWLADLPWIEIVGYVGSVLVAVSLAMSDILRLRVLNLVGAAVFTVYGLLVPAYPVAALNGFIVLANVYYLARMMRDVEYFEVLDVTDEPGPYLARFLVHHAREIATIAPGLDLGQLPGARILMILRNLEPAGLVIWTDRGEGTVRVELDYAVPRYRDLRCGRWFFRDREAWFAARGHRRFEAHTPSARHGRYLIAVGFRRAPHRGPGWYERPVPGPPTEGRPA